MRTTIDIEPDVLNAAKEIARQQHVAVGRVVSALMREALTGATNNSVNESADGAVAGFEPFPARGVVVTNEIIDQIRDAEGI